MTIVAIASFQHFDLVEDHYYDRGIEYQTQIDRIRRTNELAERPRIRIDPEAHRLNLTFPASLARESVSGNITLFRPSGSSRDTAFAIHLDKDNLQFIDVSRLPLGYWKAKLQWESRGQEYYLEDSLFLR